MIDYAPYPLSNGSNEKIYRRINMYGIPWFKN
jgi:hypothetical protein